MDFIVIIGAKYVFIVAPLVGLWIFYKVPHEKKLRFTIIAAVSLVLVYLVGLVASLLYSHPQPFAVFGFTPLVPHNIDNAFPSHHTLFAAAIAGIIYFYHRQAGLWLWLVAMLVGLSRMYAGLHWGIDVLASLIIAGVVTWAVQKAAEKKFPERKKQPAPTSI